MPNNKLLNIESILKYIVIVSKASLLLENVVIINEFCKAMLCLIYSCITSLIWQLLSDNQIFKIVIESY